MIPRVQTRVATIMLLASSACADGPSEPALPPVAPPDPIVWQTFPQIPTGARAFDAPDTINGHIWRIVLQSDSIIRVQAVTRVPQSRKDSILEYRGTYSERDSRIAFTSQLGEATGTLRGDTLRLEPDYFWDWSYIFPLVYLRSPRTRRSDSPPDTTGERVFVEGSPIYRNQGMALESHYILYDDLRFVLKFSGGFEYRGTYKESNGAITFDWEGWSTAGAWGATASLRGDTLDVKYNVVMQLSDFVDGIYIRKR